MTKWQLFGMLALPDVQESIIASSEGCYNGIVVSIERESGDGQNFNVGIRLPSKGLLYVHVRTID